MDDVEYEANREAVIKDLKGVIEKCTGQEEAPRAIGGPYNLTPEDMLREVENNTKIGREIVEGYAKVWAQFPFRPDQPRK